jgi:hypothetical protein
MESPLVTIGMGVRNCESVCSTLRVRAGPTMFGAVAPSHSSPFWRAID